MTNHCHKCGSTSELTGTWHKSRFVCESCKSKSGYRHAPKYFTYDGTPEWQEKSRVSMERILSKRT